MLPDGLRIVPYYDRSELVDAALATVSKVLLEGIVLVVVVLFSVSGRLTLQPHRDRYPGADPGADVSGDEPLGMSANLMSLGGLAIAIGLMVDGSVVVVENVFASLDTIARESRMQVGARGCDGSGNAGRSSASALSSSCFCRS